MFLSPSTLQHAEGDTVCSELIGADEEAAKDMLLRSKAVRLLLDEKEKQKLLKYIERFSGTKGINDILAVLQSTSPTVHEEEGKSVMVKQSKAGFRRRFGMYVKKCLLCGGNEEWLRD